MKHTYKLTLIIFLGLFISSCGNEYDIDEYFDLEELPGYVAFDAPGNTVTIDPFAVTEDGGSVGVVIECPTGTQSDINVSYTLSGDAVFGVDFTISGAQASGGNITIAPNPSDIQESDRASLSIELLTDDVVDGEKTIMITLTSASNAEGDLAVGRGGTDLLKTAVVVIADIDM